MREVRRVQREVPPVPDETRRGILERNKHFSITGPDDGVYRAKASFKDGQHSMQVSLLVREANMEVLSVEGAIKSAPHSICASATDRLGALVGMRIRSGLFREMQSRVGGPHGCIHMNELIRECVQLVAAHRSLMQVRDMVDAGKTDEQIMEWAETVRSWTCIAAPEPIGRD